VSYAHDQLNRVMNKPKCIEFPIELFTIYRY